MQDSLVSVIVPCHNASHFIETAIRSILEQTHKNTEIIVVDDGSTDSSCDIVDGVAPRAKLLRQPNRGAAAARNAGLAIASGEYIAFIDADDWWHPKKLEVQLEHLRTCGECEAVYARWQECASPQDDKWQTLLRSPAACDASKIVPNRSGWLYRHLLIESVVHTSSVLLPRGLTKRVGWFDEDLRRGQDLDYWIRVSRLVKVHKLDCVLSGYRLYQGSSSTLVTPTNYRALIVERALREWGLLDPEGTAADADQIRRVLQRSWEEFGYAHLKNGSPRIALESFGRAQRYSRSRRLLGLKVRAVAKLLVRPHADPLDPRHEARTETYDWPADCDGATRQRRDL